MSMRNGTGTSAPKYCLCRGTKPYPHNNDVSSAALEIIRQDPLLGQKKNSALRTRLQQRYERGMELFRVGS